MSDSIILAVVTITIPALAASAATVLGVRTRKKGKTEPERAAEPANWYRTAWLQCRSALRHLVQRAANGGITVPDEAYDALDLTPPETLQ